MAYDEQLVPRIRTLVRDGPALTEKKMFGGHAFLVGGNMAVAASSHGGVTVRVDPAQSDALVAETPARVVEMRGRPMRGRLYLEAGAVADDAELRTWVERGTSYARTVPPK